MGDNLFKIIFLVCLILTYILRIGDVKRRRENKFVDRRIPPIEGIFNILAFIGLQLIPLLYLFTPWFSYADYPQNALLGVLGTIVFGLSLVLMWRAHTDLGRNWSPTLEIREGHTLVTQGIYHYIRHPIYAAHWLWALAQVLLLPNWVAGFAGLILFAPIYFSRVPREEQMMIEHFGDEYRTYMKQTGRVVPHLTG